MQYERRIALEPSSLLRSTKTRNDPDAHRHVSVVASGIDTATDQVGIPKQRTVIENGVIRRERHVVRQSSTRQLDGHVVHQLSFSRHHSVVHEGCRGLVVEEQQFPGAHIHLGVSRYSCSRKGIAPRLLAKVFQRVGIQPIQVTALIKAGYRHACMHHDVGTGCILHSATRARAVAQRLAWRFRKTRPQCMTDLDLCTQSIRLHESIAVLDFAIAERHHVDHAVAIEWVVPTDRLKKRVFGVTQVHAVQLCRNLTDHIQVARGELGSLRPPRTTSIRVGITRRKIRGISTNVRHETSVNPPSITSTCPVMCGLRTIPNTASEQSLA